MSIFVAFFLLQKKSDWMKVLFCTKIVYDHDQHIVFKWREKNGRHYKWERATATKKLLNNHLLLLSVRQSHIFVFSFFFSFLLLEKRKWKREAFYDIFSLGIFMYVRSVCWVMLEKEKKWMQEDKSCSLSYHKISRHKNSTSKFHRHNTFFSSSW